MTKDSDAPNFGSRWQKVEVKALKEISLANHFQEKYIRTKTVTDADGQNATAILGHEYSRATLIYKLSK